MLEPSKEDFKQCVHDLGTVWSYYPENNYGTQARYGKIGNSLCPFCKFNRLEDGLKKLDEQNTYFREQANHWNTLAEKVTLENERLKAENAELHKINTRDNTYLTSKESELKSQVDRLSASLAAAHGALEKVRVWGGSIVRIFDRELIESDHPKIFSQIDEILSDPSGSVAFEKWKKMGAVVEAARACYEEDDFITENSPGSFERDKKLGEALEALDAKGERE